MDKRCPLCNEAKYSQKISSIVLSDTRHETQSGYYSGLSYGYGRIGTAGGIIMGSVYSTSLLSKMLMPPKAPKRPKGLGLGCIIPLVIFYVFGIGAILFNLNAGHSFNSHDLGGIAIWVGIGSVFLIIHIWKLQYGRSEYSSDKPRYDKAIEIWDQLYYCHKDDCVYNPSTRDCFPPTLLKEYVFSHS